MQHSIYGRKMFVIDLTITTIWLLFSIRYYSLQGLSPWFIWAVLRIILCFEMLRKSPWILYSAIAFTSCYICFAFGNATIYPIERIIYFSGAGMGEGTSLAETLRGDIPKGLRTGIYLAAATLNIWLIGVPLVVGIFRNNINAIDLHRRWILVYIIITLMVSVPIGWFILPSAGMFLTGFLLCFLPMIYWMKYERKGRSVIAVIAAYRPAMLYIKALILISLCLLIGIDNITVIKAMGLIIMPPLFYLLICRGYNYVPLTRHAIALSLSGFLFYFILTASQETKFITLTLSFLLALYAGIDIARRKHNIPVAVIMFVMPLGIISPLLLGLNPYAVLDADSVSKYYNNYYAGEGIFIISKDGKYGLRDRYGIILEPKYDGFARLDSFGHNISTLIGKSDAPSGNRYGIYSLTDRGFLAEPESANIARLVQSGQNRFDLIAPDGTHFATLLLHGLQPDSGRYIGAPVIEPYPTPDAGEGE